MYIHILYIACIACMAIAQWLLIYVRTYIHCTCSNVLKPHAQPNRPASTQGFLGRHHKPAAAAAAAGSVAGVAGGVSVSAGSE